MVADALSRKPYFCSMSTISADWKVAIIAEYAKDSFATDILDGRLLDDRYKVTEDLILYEERVYLVPNSKLKERIIGVCYDTPLAGHPGFYKTYKQGSASHGKV